VHARQIAHERMCLESRELFKVREISDNISLTVQDRGILQ